MKTQITLAIFLFLISATSFAKAQRAYSSDSIYNIKTSWINQNAKPVQLESFQGRPLVLAMIYTSCEGACPLIVSDMQKIEKILNAKDKVQFALFSFDPEKDNPAQLKKYAKAHSLNLKNWTLLTAPQNAVRELAAVLGVQYKKDTQGDFSHSDVITVLDLEGKIRHQQIGLEQDPKATTQLILELLKTKK